MKFDNLINILIDQQPGECQYDDSKSINTFFVHWKNYIPKPVHTTICTYSQVYPNPSPHSSPNTPNDNVLPSQGDLERSTQQETGQQDSDYRSKQWDRKESMNMRSWIKVY